MSVAPHAGIVDFGTFTPPDATKDGIQGEVPQPLAGQQDYVLTANGFVPSGSIPGLGTMATQNANAVAITGGTINGTTIGATTPAAGTFTTITGQTEVLKGTGTNMVPYSQAFATGGWGPSAVTVTNNTTTAPDATTTATSLIESATTASHWIYLQQTPTLQAGTYTMSVYAKANGRTAVIVGLAYNGSGSNNYGTVTFDLSGVAVAQANTSIFTIASSSITSVGSGWYRCVASITIPYIQNMLAVIAVSNATTYTVGSYGTNSYTGNGTSGLYIWGAQLEPASTVGTYIPTTSTPLLGSPTLSFSNLSLIGLQNDGALYLQPYSTGALQASATTLSSTGGNARGANAVDFQMVRSAASQVASASTSFIGSGRYNTASGQDSVVIGGYGNTASQVRSVIAGGESGTASGNNCYVGSGYQNTAAGNLNFIGGGQANSGTSGSAVTTQTAATTSGSTAVTLAASNANIKVGQWVEGTGVNNYTYVAAVSGTSLTLSANATATNAAITLTFRTPFGTVVGGGNNQATGSYSFIGGGGDAGTAANRNTASGDWSVVCGGYANIASGLGAFIGGGGVYNAGQNFGNTASGQSSVIGGGAYNTATASYGSVLGGVRNNATGQYSSVFNGFGGTSRGIQGNAVFVGAYNSVTGDNQAAVLVLTKQTTDATASALTWGGGAAGSTNQVILPNNSAYFFRGEVVSGVTGGGNTKGWTIEGVIKRGANAASTALVGTPQVVSSFADVGAATWTIAVTADTTNGGLAVTFTGQAATTIRTVAQIRTTEMTY